MSLGVVMLVHTSLDRAIQVATHWARSGCPVVIHVDSRVAEADVTRLTQKLAMFDTVLLSARHACEWGSWSIVAATQSACELMLERFPQVEHVYLASGSCLPLRRISELEAYLSARPDVDFIESVTTDEVEWTVGGLAQERFMFRFPFSWRKQRGLFDGYVRLQRRLKYKRQMPDKLVPHLGSQWWCLTRKTLSAILTSENRAVYDRYFQHVWIPDESYFQTLTRRYGTRIESRSLTMSKFDFQGKPHVFYDDHKSLLERSNCFVARKIWPRAEDLYRSFLIEEPKARSQTEPNPLKIDQMFSKARDRRTRGRTGLNMTGRLPNHGWENGVTSGRYSIFQGYSDLFENFEDWLSRRTGNRVQGHLFSRSEVQFSDRGQTYNGALSDSTALRDYRPRNFLTNLIWNTRGEHQCIQFSPRDHQEVRGFITSDRNAHINVITGAWAIPIFHSDLSFAKMRQEAARLQKIEGEFVEALRSSQTKARVSMWNLAEFVANPVANLQAILDDLGGDAQRRPTEMPQIVDLTGFGEFLQELKNQGMSPTLMGDFSVVDGPQNPSDGQRPYLVN